MSTKSFAGTRAVAGAFLAAAWGANPLPAAEVDFHPAMSLGLFHDGNLAVVGEGTGDEGAALSFDLAVDRKTPTTTFEFSYRPSYVTYRRATDLDYFGNTIVSGLEKQWSRGSSLKFDVYVSRSDYQGQTADTADRATTFVPRTTRTLADVALSGNVAAGRRGFVDWRVRVGADRYEDAKDNPATVGDETNDFNNAAVLSGGVAWRSEISARNSLGAGVDIASFRYEDTPGVDVESVAIVGASQAAPSWLITYAAGASRASSDGDSIGGFSFNAAVEYTALKASTFGAGVRQVFAPGTGLGSSTQDRGIWVSYSHRPPARGLSGSAVAGYWNREELAFASTTGNRETQSLNVNGSIGWTFNRYLELKGVYAFVDQSASNASDPAFDTLNTTYSSYGLNLRWAIRGR